MAPKRAGTSVRAIDPEPPDAHPFTADHRFATLNQTELELLTANPQGTAVFLIFSQFFRKAAGL
jgi:hypothetical protein